MTTGTRALVLSGGGYAGGAWMAGFVHGLLDRGVDLGEADLIVGTSAGARTGAQIASGVLDEAIDIYLTGAAAHEQPATLAQYVEATMAAASGVEDEREASRRITSIGPIGDGLVSQAERKRAAAAIVPIERWPVKPLLVTAVEAESGARTVFDARSGVDLIDALAASSALPGIVELIEIGGRRYADGGVHSAYNADLAKGHDSVLVITPLPLFGPLRERLDGELAALGGAAVHVIAADDASLGEIGPDPLSPRTGPAALEAGAAQAARELEALSAAWVAGGQRL